MKFEVGKLYQLVSGPSDSSIALYPDEALTTKEHKGKLIIECSNKIVLWNFKDGPFLVVANNEGLPVDADFYRIISSKGTAGWIRLPAFVYNSGFVFKELKNSED